MSDVPQQAAGPRKILSAELVAIGTELTVGETIDTNSGELARSLVAHGVRVGRVANLPDDLPVVVEALQAALGRADLVVTTGGLGPTPDDLTREAVAAVCNEELAVDDATLAWLHRLWARRRLPFPSTNIKQAWIIPSAAALANPNGTAPGWWVDRPDGRVIVNLPGPPREMHPMWTDEVLPRLGSRGVGVDSEVRTLRLHGIGESQVAERLGEVLLRAANPIVATYARHEAVDVRISARAAGGRAAAELAGEAEAAVLAHLSEHVWARGNTTWADAIGEALAERGWSLAMHETGTRGALVGLLRTLAALTRAEVTDAPGTAAGGADDAEVMQDATAVRDAAGASVGFAVRVGRAGDDLAVEIGVVTPKATRSERRIAFLRGSQGADRAAIAAAAVLLAALREGSVEANAGDPAATERPQPTAARTGGSPRVRLRPVEPADLEVLFRQQLDPDANRMAAFTPADPADRAAFDARWTRILGDPSIVARAVVADDRLAGSISMWRDPALSGPEVTYWLGRELWGRGIASEALRQFVALIPNRPLYGRAASSNPASVRVLEGCGFRLERVEREVEATGGVVVDELILRLDG